METGVCHLPINHWDLTDPMTCAPKGLMAGRWVLLHERLATPLLCDLCRALYNVGWCVPVPEGLSLASWHDCDTSMYSCAPDLS